MSDDTLFAGLPPALAQALTRRGFTALTAVQESVLDPALADHDLRIASQTGSGKTLAVGFVLASSLEGEQSKGPGAARPKAILIAPTRELAAQLHQELSWLYQIAGKRVAVVAGGASYRDELRALAARPQIVVGTPGRLLDHLEKGHIDTSEVASVVLDEADQMLDLGFRDELEAILGKTPEERRTHLVSATFSREVMSLANRYQRNAKLVEGSQLGEANTDITHVVHVVRGQDQDAAIINLLLLAPNDRALLFVRTRAGATALSELLSEAGLPAMPLSGELEQRERNKTLAAFRSGMVRTLVATDVAARGLDVPEVARVLHIEPPTDVEGFTHRSGRTGRAGKKGTSVILVPPQGKERLRSLLRRAGVQANWAPVPGKAEVYAAADARLSAELAEAPEPDERLAEMATALLDQHDPLELVAKLLSRSGHLGPTEPRFVPPEPKRQAPHAGYEGARRDRDARDYDRPAGRFGRDERPAGKFGGRDERPAGKFGGRDERPAGKFGSRDERPAGKFGSRDERPAGKFGSRDERPAGKFGSRDERPRDEQPDRAPRAPRTQALDPVEPLALVEPLASLERLAPLDRPFEAPPTMVVAAPISAETFTPVEPTLAVERPLAAPIPFEPFRRAEAQRVSEAAPAADGPSVREVAAPELHLAEAEAPARPAKKAKRERAIDKVQIDRPVINERPAAKERFAAKERSPERFAPKERSQERFAPKERFAPQAREERGPRSERPRSNGDFVSFQINWGEEQGADARRLLAMLCRRGHIEGDRVGAIRVGREGSTFEIRADAAPEFERATTRPDPRNPGVTIEALGRPQLRAYGKRAKGAPHAAKHDQKKGGGWDPPRSRRPARAQG